MGSDFAAVCACCMGKRDYDACRGHVFICAVVSIVVVTLSLSMVTTTITVTACCSNCFICKIYKLDYSVCFLLLMVYN